MYIYTYMREAFSYIGMVPKCGKTAHVWEDSPRLGRPRRARSRRVYRDDVSPIWEHSPHMRGLPYMGTGCSGGTLWMYTPNLGGPIWAVCIQPIGGIPPITCGGVYALQVLNPDRAAARKTTNIKRMKSICSTVLAKIRKTSAPNSLTSAPEATMTTSAPAHVW